MGCVSRTDPEFENMEEAGLARPCRSDSQEIDAIESATYSVNLIIVGVVSQLAGDNSATRPMAFGSVEFVDMRSNSSIIGTNVVLRYRDMGYTRSTRV